MLMEWLRHPWEKWALVTFSFSWNAKFNKLKCLGFSKAWQAVNDFVYTATGSTYPDISWPEIESLSFICIFYFQFQLICNFPSEHYHKRALNEMGRRQRIESTETTGLSPGNESSDCYYCTFSFSWFAISAQSIGSHYQTKREDDKDSGLLRLNTHRL